MMKRILLTAFTVTVLSLFSIAQQTVQQKNDSVTKLVQQYFNEKNAAKIYGLTGEEFKKQLSAERFEAVCKNQLFPIGKLNKCSFISLKNNVSKYRAEMDLATLAMYISLDSADKLYTFLFQPYKDEGARRKINMRSDNKLLTLLDKQVDTIMQNYFADTGTIGASVGIYYKGKTYFYNYGETVKGSKQLPGSQSIYEIGSITKTFAATLLAMAVNEGKVKLDDAVNKYLPADIPALQFNSKPVTLLTLSNHTSALPRLPDNLKEVEEEDPYRNYDDKAMMDFLKTVKLAREPGKEYEYSNFAPGLLGVILEKTYKKPFNELVLEKICKPLQMPLTSQSLTPKSSKNFTQGYNETGKPNAPWTFKSIAAAGALRSTTADLLKYAIANISTTDTALQKANSLARITTFEDGSNEIALGWHKIKLQGYKVVAHGGGTGGYRTFIAFIPEKKVAVVGLSNCAVELQNDLLKLLGKLL